MKGSNGRRSYSKEFKEDAVRLVTEGGRKVPEVARGLGIHENMLYKWQSQYKQDSRDSFPGKGHLKPHEEEMRDMQRELAQVKEEREILKKALAIFSKQPK